MEDPVKNLREVVEMAETRQKIAGRLCMVRRISETDMQTIERLIKERMFLVRLLQENSDTRHFHRDFDFEYKENFEDAIYRLLETYPRLPKGE